MKIVHCKREPYTVYIGRPSPFGNPFVIGKDGDRADVIEKYRVYFHAPEQKWLRDLCLRLPADAVLGCWCVPNPCHGAVIRDFVLQSGHANPPEA